jgi:tellurite resistance protein TehA-like permease
MPAEPHFKITRLAGTLPSGSFAFVMATGIVSIAALLLGFGRIAKVLFAINLIAYGVLSALTLLRLGCGLSVVVADFCDPRKAPGFLTIVAGTNVLGDQVSLLTAQQGIAAGLWLCGSVLWIGLVYGFFVVRTVRREKPPLADGLDGSWLLVTVATQSAAILGAQTAATFSSPTSVLFCSVALWLLGGALYVVIITLILYHWLFRPVTPASLNPSYWINMGAAAITTLAGARLAASVSLYPALSGLHGYIVAETMLFWSVASWWIPFLAAVMGWRHWRGGLFLSKPFEYWSMVFPLGMYAAATFSFIPLVGAEFLEFLPHLFFWLAFVAWCATASATLRRFASTRR